MADSAKGKKNGKTQSDKFIEAAKTLGCDESEAVFDKKLKKIATRLPQKTGGNS